MIIFFLFLFLFIYFFSKTVEDFVYFYEKFLSTQHKNTSSNIPLLLISKTENILRYDRNKPSCLFNNYSKIDHQWSNKLFIETFAAKFRKSTHTTGVLLLWNSAECNNRISHKRAFVLC